MEKDNKKLREQAMPEVKRMVKKHGRNVISWCINQLKEYEKKVKQLDLAKKEVSRLEKDIK